MVHDDTPSSSDLFQGVLTMLDPEVVLSVVALPANGKGPANGNGPLQHDLEQARQLDRDVDVLTVAGDSIEAKIIDLAQEGHYDLIIVDVSTEPPPGRDKPLDASYLLHHAACRVFVTTPPAIPQEPEE
jgi:hypothetical protein